MTSRRRRSRARAEATLQRLEREYDEFETVETAWERTDDEYERIHDQFERGALGGAGVWLTNDAGEVLLVRNEGDEGWAEPGGTVEPGESYETAARREVREEAGVECSIVDLREVQVVENVNGERDAPSIHEVVATFSGEYQGGEPRAREGEIAEVGWFSEPPETVLYEKIRERPYPAGA